jgi:hypothetical protein
MYFSKNISEKGILYIKNHLNHTFIKKHTKCPGMTIKYGQKETLNHFLVEKHKKKHRLGTQNDPGS